MKHEQKRHLFFIIAFLALIYAIPIVQAFVEFKTIGKIRCLDIVSDATITPYRRAVRLHSLCRKLSFDCDTLSKENDGAGAIPFNRERISSFIDDALQITGEMKSIARTINRHIVLDSVDPRFFTFDSISSFLENLQQNADAGPEAYFSGNEIGIHLKQGISDLMRHFPQPRAFDALPLCLKTYKYIFWNDRYIRLFEKELDDNSIFASVIRPAILHARFAIFRDLGDKGIQGQNKWMFYTPDVEYLVKPSMLDSRSIPLDPNNKPLIVGPIEAILRFKRQLAKRGVDLLIVIVPGKPSIYPDLLIKKMRQDQSAAFSHSLEMIKELRLKGVETVDLFTPFVHERSGDLTAGDSLYLRTDTHWKGRGARRAAYEVSQRIKQYPWYSPGTTEYIVDSVMIDRTGDIAVMCGLSLTGKFNSPTPYPAEPTRCYQVFHVIRDGLGNEVQRVLYKDDFHSSGILVLGDSFSRMFQTDDPRGAGWIAHLALELSQPVASIVNDGGASTLVRESLKRRLNLLKGKKLVVWEIVERDFRFGAEGWKDVPIEGDAQ
jgi:hypothetical protein